MMSYFLLGQIQITDAAKRACGRVPLDLVAMHAMHEHGMLSKSEHAKNRAAIDEAGEIISRYRTDPTNPKSPTVLVRTQSGWGKTTVSLESRT